MAVGQTDGGREHVRDGFGFVLLRFGGVVLVVGLLLAFDAHVGSENDLDYVT